MVTTVNRTPSSRDPHPKVGSGDQLLLKVGEDKDWTLQVGCCWTAVGAARGRTGSPFDELPLQV